MTEFFEFAQNLSVGGFLLILLGGVLAVVVVVLAVAFLVIAIFGIKDIVVGCYRCYQHDKKVTADHRRQQEEASGAEATVPAGQTV